MADKCFDCGAYHNIAGIGARHTITAALLCSSCFDSPDPRVAELASLHTALDAARAENERLKAEAAEARSIAEREREAYESYYQNWRGVSGALMDANSVNAGDPQEVGVRELTAERDTAIRERDLARNSHLATSQAFDAMKAARDLARDDRDAAEQRAIGAEHRCDTAIREREALEAKLGAVRAAVSELRSGQPCPGDPYCLWNDCPACLDDAKRRVAVVDAALALFPTTEFDSEGG